MKTKVKTLKTLERGVKAEWADGKVSTYDLDELPEEIVRQCAIHGMSQKIMDAHSGQGGEGVAACRATTDEVYENLIAGEWNKKATGGLLAEAVAELFGIEVEDAREKLAAMDKKTVSAVEKDPRVVAWKAQRALERAQKKMESAEEGEASEDLTKLFA